MADPTLLNVVWAAAVGAGATGFTAGFAKLFALGTGQARIEQKLDDHIVDERAKFDHFSTQLKEIRDEMPNGELQVMLRKLGAVERAVVGKASATYRKKRSAAKPAGRTR